MNSALVGAWWRWTFHALYWVRNQLRRIDPYVYALTTQPPESDGPTIITCVEHGFAVGDEVEILGAIGGVPHGPYRIATVGCDFLTLRDPWWLVLWRKIQRHYMGVMAYRAA